MNIKSSQLTADEISKIERGKRNARRRLYRNVATWFTSRSRDLALGAIVLGAFVAVFDGSLYSARAFAFTGWSAYAFAVMPDALMVLSAAKMRQTGITAAQHKTARDSMHFGLAFSLLTNMIAAFLKYAPEGWITPTLLLVGAIVYHGIVVVFLWRAVETLTKVRADRKGKAHKASGRVEQVAPARRRERVTGTQPATVTA